MGNIKDRENNRARQAVSQMFSTKTEAVEEVKEVNTESKAEVTAVKEVAEPKRKGRPVVNRETKKRYTLTLLPSVYDAASQKASEQGKSLSEVVGDFLSEYIKGK